MNLYSVHVTPLSSGYEVCVFNEESKMIDFTYSRDDFNDFYEALEYVDSICKNPMFSIEDVIYEYPDDIIECIKSSINIPLAQ